MKLLFFDDFKFGVFKDGNVIDCSGVVNGIPHAHPQDIIKGVIENWSEYKGKLESATRPAPGRAAELRPRPPAAAAARDIDCMAVNYMEDGTRDAPAPIDAFHKIAHSRHRRRRHDGPADVPATIFEGECELALVIGKHAATSPRPTPTATSSATSTSSMAPPVALARRTTASSAASPAPRSRPSAPSSSRRTRFRTRSTSR